MGSAWFSAARSRLYVSQENMPADVWQVTYPPQRQADGMGGPHRRARAVAGAGRRAGAHFGPGNRPAPCSENLLRGSTAKYTL